MQINELRSILQNNTKYKNSEKWYDHVEKMSDKQVFAVYYRMLYAGEILSKRVTKK